MNIFTMLMMLACGDESTNTEGKQKAESQSVSEEKSQKEKAKQEEAVETIDYTPKMDMGTKQSRRVFARTPRSPLSTLRQPGHRR